MRRDTAGYLVNFFAGGIFGYNSGVLAGFSGTLIQYNFFNNVPNKDYNLLQGILVSIILITGCIAFFCGKCCSNKLGMKNSIIVTSVIGIAAPILMILFDNYYWMVIARGILGIALGFANSICTDYSSTISPKESRNTINGWFGISVAINFLVSYIMNYCLTPALTVAPIPAMNWKVQIAVGSVYAFILLFIAFFIDDIKQGQQLINDDVEVLISHAKGSDDSVEQSSVFSKGNCSYCMLAIMYGVANQLTGPNSIMLYGTQTLAGNNVENPLLAQILVVGIWNAIIGAISVYFPITTSRQTYLPALLLIMVGGAMSGYFGATYKTSMSGLVVLAFAILVFAYGLGPGALFGGAVAAHLPSDLQDSGNKVANMSMWITGILVALMCPFVANRLGAATFLMFGTIQFVCCVYFACTFCFMKKRVIKNVTSEMADLGSKQ